MCFFRRFHWEITSSVTLIRLYRKFHMNWAIQLFLLVSVYWQVSGESLRTFRRPKGVSSPGTRTAFSRNHKTPLKGSTPLRERLPFPEPSLVKRPSPLLHESKSQENLADPLLLKRPSNDIFEITCESLLALLYRVDEYKPSSLKKRLNSLLWKLASANAVKTALEMRIMMNMKKLDPRMFPGEKFHEIALHKKGHKTLLSLDSENIQKIHPDIKLETITGYPTYPEFIEALGRTFKEAIPAKNMPLLEKHSTLSSIFKDIDTLIEIRSNEIDRAILTGKSNIKATRRHEQVLDSFLKLKASIREYGIKTMRDTCTKVRGLKHPRAF